MKQIKVGVQASMLKEPFAKIGVYETLKKIGELGYHSVEISQLPMTPDNVAQMKRAQDECGVKIAATSASVAPSGMPGQETLATHFSKIVKDCRELNCDFIRIGMLPDVDREKYAYIGNSSLAGSYAISLSDAAYEKVLDIASNMTYLELSTYPGYMDHFVAACFLPHTDASLFPSVQV